MPHEHLEWLPLSQPTVETPPESARAVPADPPSPVSGKDGSAPVDIALPQWTIDVVSPPENWFQPVNLDSPAMYRLRLMAEQFHTTTGFDHLICLDDIAIDHYQHQLEAALTALRDMGGRALLADEVGLGKTIEAGIVMKELIERGLAHRVLIIVPAPLVWQWREEMQTKFREDFIVLEKPNRLPDNTPDRARWIISFSRARASAWAEQLLSIEYDLLIIDEAHKLKNHRTRTYRFVNRLRKRYILMLTATPVHNHLLELYNLITILRPGHLGTRTAFRRDFVAVRQTSRRPHRRTIYSRDNIPYYLKKNQQQRRELWRKKMTGEKSLSHLEDYGKLMSTYPITNRFDPAMKAILEIEHLLDNDYEIIDFEALEWKPWMGKPKVDFVCRLQLKPEGERSPAPGAEERPRLTPKNPAALRSLLREVMIRNRRSTVGVRFPPREAAVYHLNLSPPERQLYDGVTAYIREQLAAAQPDERPVGRGALKLTLATLQRQLCSSPQAVAQSLAKLAARHPEDSRLAEYLSLARSIPEGRKIDAVRVILSQYPGKMLIFTDYLSTMHALNDALVEAGHETVLFHGGLSSLERFETVRQFRKSARVMISTHSGGEGHNLQFCRQLINFDLPWNPMRIEQRIGRVHRLGQKKTVRIFNLSATDTIEAYIIDLLANKIRMFELVIGELDLILGDLDEQRGFEDWIEAVWAGSQSEAELLTKIAELEAMLDGAEATYQEIRAASDELSVLLEE